jgi:hypothetical protein
MSDDDHCTNGSVIRFVGRNRIRDGDLNTLLSCVLPFSFLLAIIRGLTNGRPLKEILFQSLGIGISDSFRLSLRLFPSCCESNKLRFVCLSDTHMCHQHISIPYGDVLIHSGDFTNHGSLAEVKSFVAWLKGLPHRTKIVVPGNHDMILDAPYYSKFWRDWSYIQESSVDALNEFSKAEGIFLLIDSGISVGNVKIWGSPRVPRYASWRTAFNKSSDEMCAHWRETLPEAGSVDVLVTHTPPRFTGDRTLSGEHCGCVHLAHAVEKLNPSYHIFGHQHNDYGVHSCKNSLENQSHHRTISINASSVNDFYSVGNREPIVFDLCVHH